MQGRVLLNVVLTILLDDNQDRSSMPITGFRDGMYQFCSPSPSGKQTCNWNQNCNKTPFSSSCRLEEAFKSTFGRYYNSDADWFIFTTGDVWWNIYGLDTELRRAEKLLLPGTPKKDVLLIGGGGLMTFSQFMILSRPALELLSNENFIQSCHERLIACIPNSPHSGCKFKNKYNPEVDKMLYSANEFVHYCLGPELRKGPCGLDKKGCEWMFGRLTHAPIGEGATAARRKFVSNAGKRKAETFFHYSNSNYDSICIRDVVLEELVAFANIDDVDMKWLDAKVDQYRLNCNL